MINKSQSKINQNFRSQKNHAREKKIIQIISNKKFHAHLKFNHHEKIYEAANVINNFPRISKLHTLLFTLLKVIIHTAFFCRYIFGWETLIEQVCVLLDALHNFKGAWELSTGISSMLQGKTDIIILKNPAKNQKKTEKILWLISLIWNAVIMWHKSSMFAWANFCHNRIYICTSNDSNRTLGRKFWTLIYSKLIEV